jgi:tryptophanyl-tRNA synthetase
MFKDKKVVFSGIQPSGSLTLGNYLGALKNFNEFSDEYRCYYCVVNEHAITVRQEPAELRRRTFAMIALYIACGLDPEKNILFIQSDVAAHAQLAWVLDCYTMFGELSRMTQFKDKSAKNADNINAGLFTYPSLMAADILLYQTELVPVGIDQKQHIEIARTIAERFNGIYGDTFVVPEPYIKKESSKIMSLADPSKKMSKSDPNENAVIRILDDKDTIIRKFKKAVTDSGSEIKRGSGKEGIENLMSIYSSVTGKSFDEVESDFQGKGYGTFKIAVGETVADALSNVQSEYKRLVSDKTYINDVIKSGREEAEYAALRTMSKVYRKIGFPEINK